MRIRQAREEAGLTQPELAHRIGLKHPQSVSNYERGLTDVPHRRLQLIAEATDKPMSFFLGEEPKSQEPNAAEEAAWRRLLDARLRRIEGALGIPPDASLEHPTGEAANGA